MSDEARRINKARIVMFPLGLSYHKCLEFSLGVRGKVVLGRRFYSLVSVDCRRHYRLIPIFESLVSQYRFQNLVDYLGDRG